MKLNTSFLLYVVSLLALLACDSDLTTLNVNESDPEPKIVVTGYITSEGAALNVTRSIPVGLTNFSQSDFGLGSSTTSVELIDDAGNSYLLTYSPRRKQFVYQGNLPVDATYDLWVNSDGLPPASSQSLQFAGNRPLAEMFSCSFDTTELRTDLSSVGVTVFVDVPEERYYGAISLVEDPEENIFVRSHGLILSQDELVTSQCGWFANDGILVASNTCFADTAPIIDYEVRTSNFYIDSARFETTEIFNFPTRVGTTFGVISEADYRYVRSLRRNEGIIEEYLLTPSPQTISNINGGYGYVMMINGSTCWIDIE